MLLKKYSYLGQIYHAYRIVILAYVKWLDSDPGLSLGKQILDVLVVYFNKRDTYTKSSHFICVNVREQIVEDARYNANIVKV